MAKKEAKSELTQKQKEKGIKAADLPKKLTINKTGDFKSKWYAKNHGMTFDIIDFNQEFGYEVACPFGKHFYVSLDDCVVKGKK